MDTIDLKRDWADEIIALTHQDLENGVHEQIATKIAELQAERDALVRLVRAEKRYVHKLLNEKYSGLTPYPNLAEEMIDAYVEISEATRKEIEDEQP